MKVLVVYRHYWPDATSYAWILKAIAERLAAEGHQVTVYSAQPSYNDLGLPPRSADEVVGGVRILRQDLPPERKTKLWTRLRSTALFLAGALRHALRSPRYDLVLVNTTPAILQGGTARLIKILRGIPYVYNCQDLHPEAGLYGGKFKPGLFYRFLTWVDRLTVRDAAAAVVLSRDMKNALTERGLDGSNVAVINNMVIAAATASDANLPRALQPREDRFRILFAGNLGHFQGLETIIDAARLLAEHADIEFLFLGNGSAKTDLVARAGDLVGRTVFFHDFVPMDVAFAAIKAADAGLVCLQSNVYKVAYPSKTMMLLNAGCPLVLVVEPESEISAFVGRENLGCACAPGDPQAVAAAVLDMAKSRIEWREARGRIARVAERYFGQDVILDQWSALIGNLPVNKEERLP